MKKSQRLTTLTCAILVSLGMAACDSDEEVAPPPVTAAETLDEGVASRLDFETQPPEKALAGRALESHPSVSVPGESGARVTLLAFADEHCTIPAEGELDSDANPAASSQGQARFSGISYDESELIHLQASSPGMVPTCSRALDMFEPDSDFRSSGDAVDDEPSRAPRLEPDFGEAIELSARYSSDRSTPAARLSFATQPSRNGIVGAPLATQPVVVAKGRDLSSKFPVTLVAFRDDRCTVPAEKLLRAERNPVVARNGSARFDDVRYGRRGRIHLRATSPGMVSACSGAIHLEDKPGPTPSPSPEPLRLAFTTQPSSSGSVGARLSTQPVVSILKSSGKVSRGSALQVTLRAYSDRQCREPAAGTLKATANPARADRGVASFGGVAYDKAEVIYLGASAPGARSACSNAVTLKQRPAPTAPPQGLLDFKVQPSSSGVAGTPLATQPVVELLDGRKGRDRFEDGSFPVTLAAFTNSLCTAAAPGTLSAVANPVASNEGLARFAGVTYSQAGVIYLRATSPGFKPACSKPVTFSGPKPTATPKPTPSPTASPTPTPTASPSPTPTASPTPSPTPLPRLVFIVQPAPVGVVGAPLAVQPVVAVQDAAGNTIPVDPPVEVFLAPMDNFLCTAEAPGTLDALQNPETTTAGVATFQGVSYSQPGTIHLLAFSPGLVPGCSQAVTLVAPLAAPAAPAEPTPAPTPGPRLTFMIQPSATGTVGKSLPTQPMLTVRSAGGTLLMGSSAAITLAAYKDEACTIPATGALSANANPVRPLFGIVGFNGVRYGDADTIHLRASSPGIAPACSSAVRIQLP